MDPVHRYYDSHLAKYAKQLSAVKAQLTTSSIMRTLVFLLGILGIYLAFGDVRLLFAIGIFMIALFLFLVTRHVDLQYKRDKLLALIKINEVEKEVLEHRFQQLPDGNEFKDSQHFFSQDIDLFGKGSFYQYINRTALQQGSGTLANLLLENAIENIPQKQEAIKELGKIPEWRQEFAAIASLVRTEISYASIIAWMEGYRPFVPAFMNYLPRLISVLSGVLLTAYLFGLDVGWPILGLFFFGLGITGRYLKKINKLSLDTAKILRTFQQYQKLIVEIEKKEFDSTLLKERRASIVHGHIKTSAIVKKFAKSLHALDQRNNILIALFANAFMLRDLQLAHDIEKWIIAHRSNVGHWFETIAFFDAYNSFGNFAFNHPEYSIPSMAKNSPILEATKAGHPLLPRKKSILNDFQIKDEQFLIITGANMAGKSTFLRTVALQIMMANVGLPVCAKSAKYTPIKLITSMRTTDSLTDDESYFFSELKRLKFIVGQIQNDRYFIVLDEILKGTNSTDKAKGSRKFVERLVRSRSTGIIATHDLSLCETSNEFPQIVNYYFDAEIVDDELHFDYTLKIGICQNMNASFLLKKMGIVE